MMTWFWVLSTSDKPRLIWVKPTAPTLVAALKLAVPPSDTDRGVPPVSTGTSLVGVMARLTVRFAEVLPSLVAMVKSAAPLASARPRKFMPLMAALTSLRVPLKLTEPVPLPVSPTRPVVLARVRVPGGGAEGDALVVAVTVGDGDAGDGDVAVFAAAAGGADAVGDGRGGEQAVEPVQGEGAGFDAARCGFQGGVAAAPGGAGEVDGGGDVGAGQGRQAVDEGGALTGHVTAIDQDVGAGAEVAADGRRARCGRSSRLAVSRLWLPSTIWSAEPWLTRCRVVMLSRAVQGIGDLFEA
jgi:hypothetical protein